MTQKMLLNNSNLKEWEEEKLILNGVNNQEDMIQQKAKEGEILILLENN